VKEKDPRPAQPYWPLDQELSRQFLDAKADFARASNRVSDPDLGQALQQIVRASNNITEAKTFLQALSSFNELREGTARATNRLHQLIDENL
jgi:hypothetical protein